MGIFYLCMLWTHVCVVSQISMICVQSVRFVGNPCMQGRLEVMWPMVWVMMPKVVEVYVSL